MLGDSYQKSELYTEYCCIRYVAVAGVGLVSTSVRPYDHYENFLQSFSYYKALNQLLIIIMLLPHSLVCFCCMCVSVFKGIANCFAGGIFMMLGFGHMLPEASEQFSEQGN